MKFDIKNRFTGEVIFSCELSGKLEGSGYALQIGFAVKKAIESSADLNSADLSYADLSSADLRCANLSSADLRCANLRYANLSSANLRYANLRYANLRCANLRCANLRSADLSCANLRSAKNSDAAIAYSRILPEGSIIGWKKLKGGVIAKLRIPEEAKRSHAFGRKCRAEYADVVELFGAEEGVSNHDGKTVYKAGERVTPDSFSEKWEEECAPGIHFFITRLEAEEY